MTSTRLSRCAIFSSFPPTRLFVSKSLLSIYPSRSSFSKSRDLLPLARPRLYAPFSTTRNRKNLPSAPSDPNALVDPYFLLYEGPLTRDIVQAKTVFLGFSAGLGLLFAYAVEKQRVGIPYGEKKSIAAQFAFFGGGYPEGYFVLATFGCLYLFVAAYLIFLLRRYVTRVYLYRRSQPGRFLALTEPLLPSNAKTQITFGLEDVKDRSAVGPYLKDRAYVNAVVGGKPVFIDPAGFILPENEELEVRREAFKLMDIIKEGSDRRD